MARAFLLDSNVLLLDEPTANLDPNSAIIIEEAIAGKKSSQCIIIMALITSTKHGEWPMK